MATSGGWRYLAQRMTGNGSLGEFIDLNLPLTGVQIEEVLSGHNGLTASVTPEVMRLKGPDGRPLIEEWGAAIWAEDPNGEIRGGGIVNHMTFDGPNWAIECIDISGALVDLPYTESRFWINVDPLDIFREIWRYAQAQLGGNYGVSIDATKSPVLLGGDLVQRIEFDTESDQGNPTPDPGPAPAPDPEEPGLPLPAAPNRYASNKDWREAGVKAMKAVGWNKDKVDDILRRWLNKDAAKKAGTWKPLDDRERLILNKTIEKIGPPPNPPTGYYVQAQPTVTNLRESTVGGPTTLEAEQAQSIIWSTMPTSSRGTRTTTSRARSTTSRATRPSTGA